MKRFLTGRVLWSAFCLLLLALAAACVLTARVTARSLLCQREAERWRGDSEQSYAQISCFLPRPSAVGLKEIYTFRYAVLEELDKAGFEGNGKSEPFLDAWSCEGKVTVTGERGTTAAPVTAVGGAFFEFHPLLLLSGSYLTEEDLSHDRVLLDRALAWELFGGTELTDLRVQINGVEFVVGGVVERENDWASRRANTGEKGLFMSYDAYCALTNSSTIDCYEIVLPEIVRNYAAQLVADRFPNKDGENVVNSSRFDSGRLLNLSRSLAERAAHSGAVSYPYWENAARIAEYRCAVLWALAALLGLPPALTALVWLIRLLAFGKRRLEEDVFPRAKEGVEEAVRVRARRRWEKKHPS